MSETGRRVLQVITSSARRGAEVFATELAPRLAGFGWVADTVALVDGTGTDRLEVPVLGAQRLGVSTIRALRSRARACDVVIAHGSTTLPACALATAATGVPFVYRSIGALQAWNGDPVRRARTRVLLRRASRVVVLSEAGRSQAVAVGARAEQIVVIPNGVDSQRFVALSDEQRARTRDAYQLPTDRPLVAFVGALSEEKDPLAAVTATGLTRFDLAVVGDGPLRGAVAALGAEVAPDRVHVLGSVPDPAALLAASDVIVSSSRTEGLPAVLIEAGLCGVPAVTTDVGFVREIVVDGETGRVVRSGDPAALAAALEDAVIHRIELGARARAHCADRFDLAVVSRAWDSVLSAVVR